MNPFKIALDTCGADLYNIMDYCFNHGIVCSNKHFFLCAYPTNHTHIETKSKLVLDKPDTYLICMCAGNMKKAIDFLEPKNFIAFERFDGEIRLHDFDRFRRLVWAAQ